jgi:hypothetical protein
MTQIKRLLYKDKNNSNKLTGLILQGKAYWAKVYPFNVGSKIYTKGQADDEKEYAISIEADEKLLKTLKEHGVFSDKKTLSTGADVPTLTFTRNYVSGMVRRIHR